MCFKWSLRFLDGARPDSALKAPLSPLGWRGARLGCRAVGPLLKVTALEVVRLTSM